MQAALCKFTVLPRGAVRPARHGRTPPPSRYSPSSVRRRPPTRARLYLPWRDLGITRFLSLPNRNPSYRGAEHGGAARRRRLGPPRANPGRQEASPCPPLPPRGGNRRGRPPDADVVPVFFFGPGEFRRELRPPPFISGSASSSHTPRVTSALS